MSSWTYINGTVTVRPMGRTQPEKRYILETVLNHLPRVTGSEGDMNTYIIQKNGYNSSSSCDEFGEVTNNLVDSKDGYKEPNWCEFMMYDRAKNSDYPMTLAYKYFNDEENDKEVERRMNYRSNIRLYCSK